MDLGKPGLSSVNNFAMSKVVFEASLELTVKRKLISP